MDNTDMLACVGDNALPFIIVGLLAVAVVVLIVAFVFMKKKK